MEKNTQMCVDRKINWTNKFKEVTYQISKKFKLMKNNQKSHLQKNIGYFRSLSWQYNWHMSETLPSLFYTFCRNLKEITNMRYWAKNKLKKTTRGIFFFFLKISKISWFLDNLYLTFLYICTKRQFIFIIMEN